MTIQTYDDLYGQAMEFYQRQEYGPALDLLTREGERFADQAVMILYLRSCMAARVDQPDLAIQILREALDRGFWYGEQIIRDSPSWQPLQGRPDFEELAAIGIARQAEAREEPKRFVLEPEGGCRAERLCPLLIALHGNGSNGLEALNGWRPATGAGWLLAALQSSQAGMTDSYIWNNQDIALREIAEHDAALRGEYAIDASQVIVAGFSMGGVTALRAVLSGTVAAQGFVLLGPGGPALDTPEVWLPLIPQAAGRGVRGFVLMGEQDTGIPQDAIRALVDLLNTHGVPCRLELVPGLAHDYPPDSAHYLERALAFINQRGAI